MNRLFLSSALCTLAGALIANGQVPSLINYQGRLTDAAGAAVTGSKNFSISLYDAATAGNLLYTESIGAVTLDANGVYSFQFGGSGTSNSQVTETLATTDAATLVYTKALANTGIVENSITVTDGTYTWSQSAGNPGAGATATANTIAGFVIGATITNGGSGYTSPPAVTIIGNGTGAAATAVLTEGVVTGITITSAGSGYTGTPTITIAPPVIPFRVDYSSGTITATYSGAPSAGLAITASYRYGTNGITGALSSGAEHWMEVSVGGVMEGTRQRVLAVPFAVNAQTSQISRSLVSGVFSNVPFNFFSNGDGDAPTRGASIAGHSVILPLQVSDNGFGAGWSARQLVPVGAKLINKIEVGIEANNTSDYRGVQGGGFGGVRLLSIDRDGSRKVIDEVKVERENGIAVISGTKTLNKNDFQYFIEVFGGTYYNNGSSGGVARVKYCKVSFEGLPVD